MEQANYDLVISVLQQATSQNSEFMKPAEEQLRKWETQRGFYNALMTIFGDQTIDTSIRWMAIVYFKNGVDKYWRKCAVDAIEDSEKEVLRHKLLASITLDESNNQLSTQLSVVISKVARFDCPSQWPQLIPILMEHVQNSSRSRLQYNALVILHRVTKILASKRLAPDRIVFSELTNTIFSCILRMWISHTETFMKEIASGTGTYIHSLEKSRVLLQILRTLSVHGFKRPEDSADCQHFLSTLLGWIKPFLECRARLVAQPEAQKLIGKCATTCMKVLFGFLQLHAMFFIPLIQPTLEVIVTLCFTDESSGMMFERFLVMSLNLLKSIILCDDYRLPKAVEDVQDEKLLKANAIKTAFFTTEIVSEICRRIVLNYLPCTDEEIQEWADDPESFAVDITGEAWKFSLRPCIESLFKALFVEYRECCARVVLSMVEALPPLNAMATESIDVRVARNREALFMAVALASYNMHEELNFDQWFLQVLIPELKVKDPRYNVVRRSVLYVLAQWVEVHFSDELRPMLYQIIVDCLSPQEDIVIRISATNVLESYHFNLSAEQILPYLDKFVEYLYQLLREVSECDSKITILKTTSFLIECLGSHVAPFIAQLAEYLPRVWDSSVEHNMLRCAVLTTLEKVVHGMAERSAFLHTFLIQVIAYSVDTSQSPSVYLMGDALELWIGVLHNTASQSDELVALADYIFPILDLGSEHLKTTCKIIESYVLLCEDKFLARYGDRLVKTLSSLAEDLNRTGRGQILETVEVIIKCYPEDGPKMFYSMLPYSLEEIVRSELWGPTCSVAFNTMSRVILHCQDLFIKLVQDDAVRQSMPNWQDNMGHVIDRWTAKMSYSSTVQTGKLMALAIASLLTLNSNIIYDRICAICLAITEVMHTVMTETHVLDDDVADLVGDSTAPKKLSDSLIIASEELHDSEEYDTLHGKRVFRLMRRDPVHSVVLCDYVRSQLEQLRIQLGEVNFAQLMDQVDVETRDTLNRFIYPDQGA